VYNVCVKMPFSTSDHCVICFNLLSSCITSHPQTQYRDFNNADWEAIVGFIESVDFNSLFASCADLDSIFSSFYSVLNDCIDRFVPLKCVDNTHVN
jgi:hypothetical protein